MGEQSFNLLGLTVSEKSVKKHFNLKGYGMTESRNDRMKSGAIKSKISHIEGQITLQIFPWGRMIIAILKCICSF